MGKLAHQGAKGGQILKAPEDYQSARPSFAFHETQAGYGIKDLSPENKAMFLDAMATRSQMSWRQMHADPYGLGAHDVTKAVFHVSIPVCLEKQQVLAIKCDKGMARLIGYRREATFHVVWFDPAGQVYEHGD